MTKHFTGETIGEVWGRKDPRAALAWVSGLTTARREITGKIVKGWAGRDPSGALDWVLRSDDKSLRSEVMKTAIAGLAGKDFPAVIAQIQTLPPGEERNRAFAAAAQGRAKSDPQAAASLLDQIPSGAAREDAATKVCQAWAASDPRAALNWLFAKAPPAKGSANLERIDGMVNQWLERAPQEVVAWARSMPAGENRHAALSSVVASLARSDLKLAGSLFAELPPESQGKAAKALAEQYMIDDFDQARAWAEALPPGAGQTAALERIASLGARTDAKETAERLSTLPPSPGRDQAIVPFASEIQQRDPEGAMVWALSISDPLERMDRLERLVGRWNFREKKAARAWINSAAGLSAAEKTHLLAQ